MEILTFKNLFNKHSIITLMKIFLPGILFLMILIVFSVLTDTYFGLLSRDVNGIYNAPPYIGMLSNTGIILWSFTVAILFATFKLSLILDKNKAQSKFLLFTGGLSLLMLIDDLFMLHEYVIPIYFHLHDSLFYFIYGLSVILICFFYFNLILKTDYILFLAAFLLFALSGFFSESVDYFGIKVPQQHFFEDGTKFIGIVSWFFYFVRTCYRYIINLLRTNQLY